MLQKPMHEGSWGHEGGICHRSGLEHVAARGRDGARRGSGQMGFIPCAPPGTCRMWSFHPPLTASFVGLESPPSFLCALMPLDPGHVLQ